ncbi:hypothetical protein JKP88DRAFT_79600 [Tribonema minus]|uniref:Nudix hydrolase domain-containing protein n=1 Tax=Tribonema minus TaxID=303371 RepID=A0A835YXX9_9STRA|nr:hypothetical protein JKP88DRAFT_79600 [Tribonema minus]
MRATLIRQGLSVARRASGSPGAGACAFTSQARAGGRACIRAHGSCSAVAPWGARLMSSSIPTMTGMPDPFPYEEGRYNSATVNAGKVYAEDTADFATSLFATITHLRHEKKNALWLRVPMDFAHYVPIAGHYGFKFHHTEENAVMMVLWLRGDVANRIPPFATHHVDVSAVVTNADGHVLVVRRPPPAPPSPTPPPSSFTFPGGLAERGEDLADAAARAVAAAAPRALGGGGVAFRGVLALRQAHDAHAGGAGALHFLCHLTAAAGGGGGGGGGSGGGEDGGGGAQWVPVSALREQGEAGDVVAAAVAQLLEGGAERSEMAAEVHASAVPGRPPYTLFYHRD